MANSMEKAIIESAKETEEPEEKTRHHNGDNLAMQSESVGNLAKALAMAQSKMQNVIKSSDNPYFNSRYADLSTVISAIREALGENEIAYVQQCVPHNRGARIRTTLIHSSGEWISDGGLFLPAPRNDAQGFGSAITYARRYGLCAMVGVGQEDDDGNLASKK